MVTLASAGDEIRSERVQVRVVGDQSGGRTDITARGHTMVTRRGKRLDLASNGEPRWLGTNGLGVAIMEAIEIRRLVCKNNHQTAQGPTALGSGHGVAELVSVPPRSGQSSR